MKEFLKSIWKISYSITTTENARASWIFLNQQTFLIKLFLEINYLKYTCFLFNLVCISEYQTSYSLKRDPKVYQLRKSIFTFENTNEIRKFFLNQITRHWNTFVKFLKQNWKDLESSSKASFHFLGIKTINILNCSLSILNLLVSKWTFFQHKKDAGKNYFQLHNI